MQMVTKGTTDERLDCLEEGVDEGFSQVVQQFALVDHRLAQVDQRFDHLEARLDDFPRRKEVDVQFKEIDRRRFGDVSKRLDRFDDRFESMQT